MFAQNERLPSNKTSQYVYFSRLSPVDVIKTSSEDLGRANKINNRCF